MKRGFDAARRAIEFLGGEIFNSTEGGNLDCIPRLPLEDALRRATQKTQAALRNTA